MRQRRPNPNSRYDQGYFDTFRPRKYVGKFPIIYRSGLEKKFMLYCEKSPDIMQWSSEPFPIPYKGPQGKQHNYWIDFVVINRKGQRVLIEVKPKKDIPQNESQIMLNPVMKKNAAKWAATKEYCARTPNTFFMIVTESFFERITIKI